MNSNLPSPSKVSIKALYDGCNTRNITLSATAVTWMPEYGSGILEKFRRPEGGYMIEAFDGRGAAVGRKILVTALGPRYSMNRGSPVQAGNNVGLAAVILDEAGEFGEGLVFLEDNIEHGVKIPVRRPFAHLEPLAPGQRLPNSTSRSLTYAVEECGDEGIYAEIAVDVYLRGLMVADVYVGLAPRPDAGEGEQEVRVLLTMRGDGEGDHELAIYPERGAVVEAFDAPMGSQLRIDSGSAATSTAA
jgi:hypothetical protein